MENKTALQQFIGQIKTAQPFSLTADRIIFIAEQFLEIEKEQMESEYKNGYKDGLTNAYNRISNKW